MIYYEVNVSINKEIYSEFVLWLNEHVNEMLQFPGFIQASILVLEEAGIPDHEKLTIQYQIKSREDLETYFNKYAPRMREEGIKRFKDKFSASRRILKVQAILLSQNEP